MKILAVNSSPKKGGKSSTGLFLSHLVRGMEEAGGDARIVHLREKNVKTCHGCFHCWTKTPGRCVQADDMTDELLSLIPAADLMVCATPLYNHTMNAVMSNFRERMLPLLQPFGEMRGGRFEQKLRRRLPPVVWLCVCGHAGAAEFEALSRFLHRSRHPDTPIVAEIYRTSAEAVKHPIFRETLGDILDATVQAGRELVESMRVTPATLQRIEQPLADARRLSIIGNMMWRTCIAENVSPDEFFAKGMKPRPDSLEDFMTVGVFGLNRQAAGDKKVFLQFVFTDPLPGACYFTIEKEAVQAAAGFCDACDIAITTSFGLWMDIVTGKAEGREMVAQKKVHIHGDLGLMLRLFQKKEEPPPIAHTPVAGGW
jgi:hypothetical protein